MRGFSFTVNKQDYDEIVVGDWRSCFGMHHYTWALRHALFLPTIGVMSDTFPRLNTFLIGWGSLLINVGKK